MHVKDYQEWTRYHAVIEFEYGLDPEDEVALRHALREEIVLNDLQRRAEGRKLLFPGSVVHRAVNNATFEVRDGVATAAVTFEMEGFRCQISS